MTTIPASLDTAYARQCGYAYDGFPVPDADDSIPAELVVFPEFYDAYGLVVTNVGETPVRLELTPVQARQYAIALVHCAEAAEVHSCAPAEGECCGHAIRIAGGVA